LSTKSARAVVKSYPISLKDVVSLLAEGVTSIARDEPRLLTW
jgi:hypothetical protein